MQKLFTLSVLLCVSLFALLFVQCSEQVTEPNNQTDIFILQKGEEPVVGNNLSFPAFLKDGYSLDPISEAVFTTVYTGPYVGLTPEELTIATGDTWYAQKVEGNIWQADFIADDDQIDVTYIDWGDNIEAFCPKVRKPFRLEVTLYKNVSSSPMTGYEMTILSYPSSPDEVQGTNKVTYESDLATIASNNARIVVQKFEEGANLSWDGEKWTGAEAPAEGFGFGVELNVAGKLIFGATSGGWKPVETGNYRITFYLANSTVNLNQADIGPAPTQPVAFPQVDAQNNLSYVDVMVVAGGGGGKKK